MRLVRDVMDKEIVDRDGFKSGKVDDLLVELREDRHPIVRAVITQQGSLAPLLGSRINRLVTGLRKGLLGMDPEVRPTLIGWEQVDRIDVVVHIDLDRRSAGLLQSEDAIWERWIKHIPFAER